MVHWRKGNICPGYMYILLYVKPIQCSGVPYIYCQLEEGGKTYLVSWWSIHLLSIGGGGTSVMAICAFFYM